MMLKRADGSPHLVRGLRGEEGQEEERRQERAAEAQPPRGAALPGDLVKRSGRHHRIPRNTQN